MSTSTTQIKLQNIETKIPEAPPLSENVKFHSYLADLDNFLAQAGVLTVIEQRNNASQAPSKSVTAGSQATTQSVTAGAATSTTHTTLMHTLKELVKNSTAH